MHRILANTPFARVLDTDAERRHLATLRWLTGIVCLVRTIPIVWTMYRYEAGSGSPDATVFGLAVLALIVAATVGVAFPVVAPALMVTYTAFDERLETGTLGTDVMNLLWGLLFLAGAGARLSVDGRLLRAGLIGAPFRLLYRILGLPDAMQLRSIYFLFFAAFAVLNFGALLHHAQDETWRSGQLLSVLFTNSYLSRGWKAFRLLEETSPFLLMAFSVAGTAGQALFQGLMLPAIWTRLGARFVIGWGTLFFLMSLAFLQLSYLPPLELLLWAALFRRPATPAAGTAPAAGLVPLTRRPWQARIIAGSVAVTLLVFSLSSLPIVHPLAGLRTPASSRAFQWMGLQVPNVFNRTDLRLGDAWAVIYRENPDELLPYHGPHGERLAWVQWSDVFFYGNSLRWRRSYQGPQSLTRDADGFRRVRDTALFDHRGRMVERSLYRVEYFSTHGSDLTQPAAARFARRAMGTDRLVCTGLGGRSRCDGVPVPPNAAPVD